MKNSSIPRDIFKQKFPCFCDVILNISMFVFIIGFNKHRSQRYQVHFSELVFLFSGRLSAIFSLKLWDEGALLFEPIKKRA